MLKQKIAFIGLGFHQKTKSSRFFIEILQKYFEVDLFWDFGDNPADNSYKNAYTGDYLAVIFWQVMPMPQKLFSSKCQNIILVPMYDHIYSFQKDSWEPYLNYKILSFSNKLHQIILDLNGISLHVQYYPEPSKNFVTLKQKKRLKFFFWQRSRELNFELIKKIIHKDDVETFYFHRMTENIAKDMWFEEPNKNDINNYNIKFSSWFNTKEDLTKLIEECDIYIVPRLFEGIGMAFLEAMSMGKCVISPDFPTMNEYIIHNTNGFLFDINKPTYINLANYQILGNNAKNTIAHGYKRWLNDEKKIIDYIFSRQNTIIVENVKEYNVHNKNMVFSKNLNFLKSYLKAKDFEPSSIILYGAGTGAELIISFIAESIAYIVDIDLDIQGKYLQKIPIFSLDKLEEDNKKIIITVFGREERIYTYLTTELHIESGRIIMLDLFN